MGSVIGDILPSAVGVAISPVPIIAVILMLFTPRPRNGCRERLAGCWDSAGQIKEKEATNADNADAVRSCSGGIAWYMASLRSSVTLVSPRRM